MSASVLGGNLIRNRSDRESRGRWFRKTPSVRIRLLAIVLIPSVTLLSIGLGASAYLVNAGKESEQWARLAGDTIRPVMAVTQALQEERRVSLQHLAGDATATQMLTAVRHKTDICRAAVLQAGRDAASLRPDLVEEIDTFTSEDNGLIKLRDTIDSRTVSSSDTYGAYSASLDRVVLISVLGARMASDAGIALRLYHAIHLLRAAEAFSRAQLVGSLVLPTGQLPPRELTELSRQVGDARGEVAYVSSVLTGSRLAPLKAITSSEDWQRVLDMEDAIIRAGAASPEHSEPARSNNSSGSTSRAGDAASLPLTASEYQRAATQISSGLLQIFMEQTAEALRDETAMGAEVARRSLWGAAGVLGLTVLAFLAALYLTNRLIRRMRHLRQETLALADERLPDITRKLSDGQEINDADLAPLDFGADEIGQIADAFNRAHTAAVNAAVAESKTRAGVNAVFLNIAHRSQVIVHRQLALLDRAEREEEDPAKLDGLFQLDHLATRSRRNAENLIILGGETPGRRWRKPVPLLDVVRGAVAESLDYKRIQTGRLPELRIVGTAVADLIHLIAELTDNATAFSPPEARVEISGNVVGKGVAIEISDQGLGMSHTELAERNAALADPVDFSVAALSSDARLGLFVVGKLAARHRISVRLTESDYGGVRAIVLIPSDLLAAIDPHPPLGNRNVLTGSTPGSTAPVAATTATPGTIDPAPASDKPSLPRRRRVEPRTTPDDRPASVSRLRPRSADEARNLMAAIQNGTRQGRLNRVDIGYPAPRLDVEEGAGDDRQNP
ncbi:nitrate- and nitrite sensing domain-containing protein [Streptomyces gardneri]|nr:nitrate- and nitrite sensing domain-containing protein [Streptomyces gardneri]MBF6475325.1 nitrate- and nitrite sensing domain-containing protein [Nocardia abscessus]